VSFASLAQSQSGPLIERFATARDLTLMVGAGASMEAQLPSWRGLIELLLTTVAAEIPELGSQKEREKWVEGTLTREDLLAAGAVVEVMAKESLEELIPASLYRGQGPEAFAPGPIAHQVAALREMWGERAEILTTNYDDLLEQALIDTGTPKTRIRSYTQNRDPGTRAKDTTAVTHLHGLAGRSRPPQGIVLSERHYHQMQRGSSWQEKLVTQRLQGSSCLFVGMSLADPNLIRYLCGYKAPEQPRHAAIFVRQGEPEYEQPVREAMERAVAKRWERCGVEPIFVDHFADAAQLLYEIGYRRKVGDGYRTVGERAAETIGAIERGLAITDEDLFSKRQVAFSASLRNLLGAMLGLTLDAAKLKAKGEIFGLTVWLLDREGNGLISWAHSDRAHQDPSTMVAAPVRANSEWVAVRTVCQGGRVELDRDNYASRWRFVRGLPLVLEEPSRLPLGCLTIASSMPEKESVLKDMPPDLRATLHSVLQSTARSLLEVLRKNGVRA
jgi:SIR2-like domain